LIGKERKGEERRGEERREDLCPNPNNLREMPQCI
jgi:hypothetical protein